MHSQACRLAVRNVLSFEYTHDYIRSAFAAFISEEFCICTEFCANQATSQFDAVPCLVYARYEPLLTGDSTLKAHGKRIVYDVDLLCPCMSKLFLSDKVACKGPFLAAPRCIFLAHRHVGIAKIFIVALSNVQYIKYLRRAQYKKRSKACNQRQAQTDAVTAMQSGQSKAECPQLAKPNLILRP